MGPDSSGRQFEDELKELFEAPVDDQNDDQDDEKEKPSEDLSPRNASRLSTRSTQLPHGAMACSAIRFVTPTC